MTVRDVGFDAGTVEASPDGTHVALGGRAGELMVLDLATDEPVREPVTAHDKVVDLTYSEDGSRLLTSGFDYKNALWDGRTGELLARVVTSQLVTEATFTGDGDTVLIAPLWAGAVFEWDTRPGPRRRVRLSGRRPRLHRGRVGRPLRRPAVRRLPADLSWLA